MNALCMLLIDDHPMFREGLGLVIHRTLPKVEIHQASSVDEALRDAPAQVSLVLLDIKLNGRSGLESIGSIKQQWPTAPVLMLSSHDDPETIRLGLARGAAAFVSKAETSEHIMDTIVQLLRGDWLQTQPEANDQLGKALTPRQREVLELLHLGLSNKLIARRLLLSDNTVRRHVQEILKYFQVATRAEAVFAARKLAMVG